MVRHQGSKHTGWAGLVALACMTAAVAGCAAKMRVDSFTEPGWNVGGYRTYAFAPVAAESTGDPRLDSNPFFNDRMQAAVDKALGARGYERAASATPDFYVHFHASLTQEIDVVEADRLRGYCASEGCRPFVYEAGTLLVDFVDAGTNRLVWRGWAKSNMNGVIDNQAWLEERIDTSIARLMATVVPRS
jgi:Domain of unknown function (DUF4136)